MDRDWSAFYHLIISDYLVPGSTLTNRYHRELRQWDLSNTPLRNMRNLSLEQSAEDKEERIPFPGEYTLTRHELPDVTYSNVVDIYWCLRIWAFAVALAGNFEVESKKTPGTKVLMMPLSVALDYADRALRLATTCGVPPHKAAKWMEKGEQE